MRPKRVTLTPQSDADGICASQTPSSGGAQNLTIDGALSSGGESALNHGHLIDITSLGNDSGRTFTVTGEDYRGVTLTESITGPNTTTVTGIKYFKKVTQVQVDADTAGAITVGVSGKCSSPTFLLDHYTNPFNIGFGVEVLGSLTYTVQHTFDDLQVIDISSSTYFNHDSVSGKTNSEDGNYAYGIVALRIIVTSFTSGTVNFTYTQTGK